MTIEKATISPFSLFVAPFYPVLYYEVSEKDMKQKTTIEGRKRKATMPISPLFVAVLFLDL